MGQITFKTKLYTIKSWTILHLPADVSAQLPSRGQVMVQATINGYTFQTPLEPDGKWGHWLNIDQKLSKLIEATAGNTVQVTIEPVKNWPEPPLPTDWRAALSADTTARAVWDSATPLAHWEWVRWIRATGNSETRAHRIEVGCSKLRSGERRPCCWNRNACSEPSVSKGGVLLESSSS